MGVALSRLREIRQRAGYSQQELADESGVSQHSISEIETGRRTPQGRTLRKLAGVLDIQVADLFGEDDSPKAETPLHKEEQRPLFASVEVEGLDATLADVVRNQREFRLNEHNIRHGRAESAEERSDANRILRNWWTGVAYTLRAIYDEIPELPGAALREEEAITVEAVKEFAEPIFAANKDKRSEELAAIERAYESEITDQEAPMMADNP
jgi:transcriptional regulator with XRE-family HTH domain